MHRICRRLSDQRIIESQSGGGSLDALIANATSAGLVLAEHEFVTLEDAEFNTALAAQITAELPNADQREQLAKDAIQTGEGNVKTLKLLKAICVSNLAWRLNKAPADVTNPELAAERDRIAAIYKTL